MRKLKNSELSRLSVEEYKESKKTGIIIVLDNVRSLHNIGSVFRTADAFLSEAVYLCGITATPPNKEIHKTALGAQDSVDWKYFEKSIDAITELRNNGYKIISVEQVDKSISLQNFKLSENEKYAVVFGHEVKGVEDEIVSISDFCVEIPQLGTKHSLNISVSVGVVLWEFARKLF